MVARTLMHQSADARVAQSTGLHIHLKESPLTPALVSLNSQTSVLSAGAEISREAWDSAHHRGRPTGSKAIDLGGSYAVLPARLMGSKALPATPG